ncbi:serine hydrolase domain-containing protein [Streptomyces sp. NPDC051567]|uniref:serine hydrolase domain-containing protein n=1 Tax=Streptomyces sp. NPDC051567 TaxID=3365660 RepID=UPI00379749E7
MTARWRTVAAGMAAVGLVVVPVSMGNGAVAAVSAPVSIPALVSTPVRVLAPASVSVPVFTLPPPVPVPLPASGEFPQLTPALARQLDGVVQKVMAEARVPGVIVSLSAPGKGEYVRAFGEADKVTDEPVQPDMNMRMGSETKTFTVTALLKLVDEGRVGLDDPIGRYVSGVPNGDRITLRQLAGMRSGLFNYSDDRGFFTALVSDPQRPFTPQELLSYSFRHPVEFPPGAKFQYSNTNAILLGLVVEKVSGVALADYIDREVVRPAGMGHTVFPTGAEFPGPHAHGYTRQTASGLTEDATDWNPSWAWAAGAMISEVGDPRTVATGTLLSPATQAERLRTSPSGLPGTGYGLGIFDVQGWIGHNGSLPGYQSLTVYLPGPQATLVVLLNTDVSYEGAEPSTLFGKAVTQVVTPQHVFDLPSQAATAG